MKHLLPLALLIGLGVPAAWGQTVTILDKEGVAHRFNADYVREITFTKQAPAEQLIYTEATANPYGSSGNVGLEFKGEDCPTVTLDAYGPAGALYLKTGTYTVASTGTEMYISDNAQYTYVTKGADKVAVTAGQMLVEEGMEGQYEISFDFTLADGSQLSGVWTGLLSNYGKIMNLTANQAKQVDINNPADGQIRLRLNDTDYSFEAIVDFFVAPGSATIPEGNYFWKTDGSAGSIGGDTEIQTYNPLISSQSKAVEGFASMRADGMTVAIDLADGRTVNIFFNGQVQYLSAPATPDPVEYKDLVVDVYRRDNVVFTFTHPDDGSVLCFDVYGNSDTTYLQPGTYPVEAYQNGKGMYIATGDDSIFKLSPNDKTGEKVVSGEMTVAYLSNNNYDITFDVTLINGTEMSGKWSGEISNYGKELSLVATDAYQVELNNAKDGQIRLRFNDADWNFENTVDFFVAPGATRVTPGTYTWSDEPTTSNIGGETVVNISRPANSQSGVVGGSATVTESAMTVNMVLPDGRNVTMTYEGTPRYK